MCHCEYPGFPLPPSVYPYLTRDSEAMFQFSRYYPFQNCYRSYPYANPMFSNFSISCLTLQTPFLAGFPLGTLSQ